MTDRDVAAIYLEGFPRLIADASATGRRLTRDELDSRRSLGEQAAEASHGMRTLMAAHLAAARTYFAAWRVHVWGLPWC